jgi:primosomal protein N' (replication factor Y)
MIVRVLPDISGFDKEFDYSVPPEFAPRVEPGAMVRIELHGRRVDGWITRVDPPDAHPESRLLPLLKIRGMGPSAEVITSAEIIAANFLGRRRSVLAAASPDTLVQALPGDRRHGNSPGGGPLSDLCAQGGGLIWCGLNQDPIEVLRAIARFGPMLLVVPSVARARTFAATMRGAGFSVALLPEEWSQAAAGVDVVIGARAAAWAPVREPSSLVVWDEHDEALKEERVPTWHVRDVLAVRAQQLGAALFQVSPIPSVDALQWANGRIYRTIDDDSEIWSRIVIADMNADDDPRKINHITTELLDACRDTSKSVVCISNATGVAKSVACRQCSTLARCENCNAVVAQIDESTLHCGSCGTDRPVVCASCGSGAFKNLRRGTSRLRTELERASARDVIELSGSQTDSISRGGSGFVVVGTEALLHRVAKADVVAFLDIDSELDSGFYRANEIVVALISRALRMVGDRGKVIVQTRNPGRDLLQNLSTGNLKGVIESELAVRRALNLPPFSVLAKISGTGASEFFDTLAAGSVPLGCDVNARKGLVRALDFRQLVDVIASVAVPRSGRVRIEVQPARA